MKRLFYYIICIATLLSSCQTREYDSRLIVVDTLLQREKGTSALEMINKINVSRLSEQDQAYYYMLKTFAQFKEFIPIQNDSDIQKSIAFFNKTGNKEKLARCYLYRANVLAENKKLDLSASLLKKAESLSYDFDNIELKNRINSTLSFVNSVSGNHTKAFLYAQRLLSDAKAGKQKRWLGRAYKDLASIYVKKGNNDSADYYLKLSIPYTQYIPPKERTIHLDNQALYYRRHNNIEKAESCLYASMKILPKAFSYAVLADLYSETNRLEEARSLWQRAFRTEDRQLCSTFLQPYAEWLYKIGEKDSAWHVAMRIPFIKDSLMHEQKTELVKESQETHDREITALQHQQERMVLYGLILFSLLVFSLIVSFLRMRVLKQKARLTQQQKELAEERFHIQEYESQISQMKLEGKAHTKENKALEKKLQSMKEKLAAEHYQGKKHYEAILAGGTTATWHKQDFLSFLSYYRTIDLPYIAHLENDFDSLSPSQMLIMILWRMKFPNEDVQRIMGMSAGALRTARSRINKRLRAGNHLFDFEEF